MKITYLISPQTIREVTNISDNLSDKYMMAAIRESQQDGLTDVAGVHFVTMLEEMVASGEIDYEDNARYKALLDNYVSYYLIYSTIEKLIPIVGVKLDNAGTVITDNEDTEHLSFNDMLRLQNYYRQKSDYYKSRLQKHLRENRNIYGDLLCGAELDSAYSSPIFLGGRRGKHIIRPCGGPCGHISQEDDRPVFTVRYMVLGEVWRTQRYKEGEPVRYPEPPQIEGYRFIHWEPQYEYMPAFDIEVSARMEQEAAPAYSYTLRYTTLDAQPVDLTGLVQDTRGNLMDVSWDEDGDEYSYVVTVQGDAEPYALKGKFSHNPVTSVDLSGLPFKVLIERAFFDCGSLKDIALPDTLEEINGGYNFFSCRSLTSLRLPTALTNIGVADLRYCASLTDIAFKDGSADNGIFRIIGGRIIMRETDRTVVCGTSGDLSSLTNLNDIQKLTFGEECLIGCGISEFVLPDMFGIIYQGSGLGNYAWAENGASAITARNCSIDKWLDIPKGDCWWCGNVWPYKFNNRYLVYQDGTYTEMPGQVTAYTVNYTFSIAEMPEIGSVSASDLGFSDWVDKMVTVGDAIPLPSDAEISTVFQGTYHKSAVEGMPNGGVMPDHDLTVNITIAQGAAPAVQTKTLHFDLWYENSLNTATPYGWLSSQTVRVGDTINYPTLDGREVDWDHIYGINPTDLPVMTQEMFDRIGTNQIVGGHIADDYPLGKASCDFRVRTPSNTESYYHYWYRVVYGNSGRPVNYPEPPQIEGWTFDRFSQETCTFGETHTIYLYYNQNP